MKLHRSAISTDIAFKLFFPLRLFPTEIVLYQFRPEHFSPMTKKPNNRTIIVEDSCGQLNSQNKVVL